MKITVNEPFNHLFEEVSALLGAGNVFLVGGFVRDTLLGRKTEDLDLCCRNNPEMVHAIYPDGLYFSRFGTTTIHKDGIEITIASLRQETGYVDYRHPQKVTFVNSIELDYVRRDFTVNCLYADDEKNIIDPTCRGLSDLKTKTLCLIGDKDQRLIEDPLRILRAYRFAYELRFDLEEETLKAIERQKHLISKLNPNKIREEIRKCPAEYRQKMMTSLGLGDEVAL